MGTDSVTITDGTKMPLRMVVGIVAAALSLAGLYFTGRADIAELKTSIHELRIEVARLNDKIDNGNSDRFRRGEMETWVRLLKAQNPTLSIPEVDK